MTYELTPHKRDQGQEGHMSRLDQVVLRLYGCISCMPRVDGVTAHARYLDLGKDQKLEGVRH